VIWSEETCRIFGLAPQGGSLDIAMVGEMFHPDDREAVFRQQKRLFVLGRAPTVSIGSFARRGSADRTQFR